MTRFLRVLAPVVLVLRRARQQTPGFAAGTIALTLLAAMTRSQPVMAAGDWVSTRSVALVDSTVLPQTTPVPAEMPMRITVSLNVQGKAGLDALVKSQNTPGNPAYHQFLTPAQFAAQYSPSTA
jgi:pseudomonalisin